MGIWSVALTIYFLSVFSFEKTSPQYDSLMNFQPWVNSLSVSIHLTHGAARASTDLSVSQVYWQNRLSLGSTIGLSMVHPCSDHTHHDVFAMAPYQLVKSSVFRILFQYFTALSPKPLYDLNQSTVFRSNSRSYGSETIINDIHSSCLLDGEPLFMAFALLLSHHLMSRHQT